MTEKITKALFLVLKGKLEPEFLYSHLNFDDSKDVYVISFEAETGYTYNKKCYGGPPYFDEWYESYILPLSVLTEMAEINKDIKQLLDDCSSLLDNEELFAKEYDTWKGWEATDELPDYLQNWTEHYLAVELAEEKAKKVREERIRQEEQEEQELQKIREDAVLLYPNMHNLERALYLLHLGFIKKEHLFAPEVFSASAISSMLYISTTDFDFSLGSMIPNPDANRSFNERVNPDESYSHVPAWIAKKDPINLKQLLDIHKTKPANDTLRTEVSVQVVFHSKVFDTPEFKEWSELLREKTK
jgi:hypothetical protein